MPAFQFRCIVAKLVNGSNAASFYYLASFYALLEFNNVYIFLCYMLYEEMANRWHRRAQHRPVLVNNACGSGYSCEPTATTSTSTTSTSSTSVAFKYTFVGSTEILMANGATEPIAQIKPGGTVLGYDPETNTFYPNVIAVTVHFMVSRVYNINGKILTDCGEIFFVSRDGHREWIAAANLRVGDKLIEPTTNGERVINSIRIENQPVIMYDLLGAQGNNFIANGVLADIYTN